MFPLSSSVLIELVMKASNAIPLCYFFSAGLGVLNMAMQAVSRMSGPSAHPHFFLLDKNVRTSVTCIFSLFSNVLSA